MNTKEYLNTAEDGINYVVYYPENFAELPLLIYLHGAGERGKNLSHIYRHGVPKLIKEGKEIPAVVLCLQCPAGFVWDNKVCEVKEIIDKVATEYGILPDRIAITGSSMGGFGTFMMVKTYPEFFSCGAPVAGGGMSWRAQRLVSTPIYALHGKNDRTVPCEYSQMMIESAINAGAKARLVLLEGYDHNDGIDYAYRNTDLIEWALKQRRTDFSHVADVCEDIF